MDDPTMATDISFGDLPPTSPPHPIGHDIFADNVNYSALNDPTSELVTAWSANTNLVSAPESASDDSDQDHPHTGCASPSSQISGVGPDDASKLFNPVMWKDIAGSQRISPPVQWWEWKGHMVADQPRAISTSIVETLATAHTVASTPTSSTPVDTKGDGKRARDNDADSLPPGVSNGV